MKSSILLLVCVVLACMPARGADNGLGDKPYMGWSSWSCFSKKFDEAAIVAQADVMADKLKKYGYTYINIDAGWHNDKDFDEHGRRLPDASKFPHGIKWLADYVHSKGLKFGLYIEPGMPVEAFNKNGTILVTDISIADITDASTMGNTLGKNFYRIDFTRPGAEQWVQSSADLLSSWGVDFIKCDFVGPSTRKPVDTRAEVKLWHAMLQKQRPVWLELSNNLRVEDAEVWRTCSNGWRVGPDVEAHKPNQLTDWSRVSRTFAIAPKWAEFAGKGGWNDLDSLEIGNGAKTGLSLEERRTVMTLWCICCAPLYLGTDLTQLIDEDLEIITNTEVIAIDQAGNVARPISQDTAQQVWVAKNADGSFIVALFNINDKQANVSVKWRELAFKGGARVRDLWRHIELGELSDGFGVELDPHACRLLKVTPVEK